MANIEDVVKLWDKTHSDKPEMQTKTLEGKNVQSGGKIAQGRFFNKMGKQAVIEFAPGYPYKYWGERTCYVFTFDSDRQTGELTDIEISFERRTKYDPNSKKFYEFLKKEFDNEEICGKEILIRRGMKNPNHLVLKIKFDITSSVKDICDGMEELIRLTQEKRNDMEEFIKPTQDEICDFLENENKEEIPLKDEEEKIFHEILDKYGIKSKNDEWYKECREIYILTIRILDKLYVEDKDVKNLEVAYYTKKSIAQDLLISLKDKTECSKFRLYHIHGMNDPNEGKTLLSFLGMESEELNLPEKLPFIACFSLEVNCLNQFRLYGKENNIEATGVSVLFDANFFNGEEENYTLCRCVYVNPDNWEISISFSKTEEKNHNAKILQQYVEKLFKDLKIEIQKLLNVGKTELAKDLLTNVRYLVKDYAFMEERECRIVDIKNKKDKIEIDQIKIDSSRNRLYIEIDETETETKIKDYVNKIYFAPFAEGMEVFEVKTDIECIRSRHPYKSTQPPLVIQYGGQ